MKEGIKLKTKNERMYKNYKSKILKDIKAKLALDTIINEYTKLINIS